MRACFTTAISIEANRVAIDKPAGSIRACDLVLAVVAPAQGSPALLVQDGAGRFRPLVA